MASFNGKWINTEQTGFVEMLIKLGVPEQRAKFIGASRPVMTFKLTDDKKGFYFKQELPKMEEIVSENDWVFGVSQEDVDENGKKGTTVWKLVSENEMEGVFSNEDVPEPTVINRKIEGDKLCQRIKIGELEGLRCFQRQ